MHRTISLIATGLLLFMPACNVTDDGKDAIDDVVGDSAEDTVAPVPRSLKEMIGGKIYERVRFVLDKSLEGAIDIDRLQEFVLSQSFREADDFGVLTATDEWWQDYQEFVEIGYYSAEHVFSDEAPYPGSVFMPHVWNDVTYKVGEVSFEYMDLSDFYAEVDKRKMTVSEPVGTEWTLLSANDGVEWGNEKFPHDPDEMVVVVANNPNYDGKPHSYYFVEEKYGAERGFKGHYFNPPFNQWPTDMQEPEGLTPHNLPIWMHFAFLNGEWDPDAKQWRLFPNGRWGGYDGSNVYFIEFDRDLDLEQAQCDVKPAHPDKHFFLDEQKFKRCLDFTERLQYDWHRLWRHAFNIPSIPFWWTEKADIRVVVVDLRDYDGDTPEYEEDDVIDWQTFEDSVRAANPFIGLTIQRYNYRPSQEIKDIVLKHFAQKADYPLHSEVKLLGTDGGWKSFHMDWDYHWDIPGLPGMQVVMADKMSPYWGGEDEDGKPLDYHPFAEPYHKTGKPFVMPALFFLTPFGSYEGKIGGWTTNSGQLMCILASQFGLECEQIHEMSQEMFGQPIGPNLNAWSDAYGLWWEIFMMDWTYTTSPVPTFRFGLDPEPFKDILLAVPEIGELLAMAAPLLFEQLFGWFHPWATGFPFWLKESMTDPEAMELSRQFASFQFAETIQHNIGYKHQTTVIPDAPYLGMEQGFDYIKHQDLNETFDMTVEESTIPFYSTEPGSRDFPIDANSYMTLKMGSGTQHMLQRIFARREVIALYEYLTGEDPEYGLDDDDFQEAKGLYLEAADDAMAWHHRDAYEGALKGLEAMDRYFTARGEPDKLHTDWDAPVSFTPESTGLTVTADQLDAGLKFHSGL